MTVTVPYHLSMVVSDSALDIMTYSPVVDNSLETRHIELDTATATPRQAMENAVYDNELANGEYGRVDVLVDTPRFALLTAADHTRALERAEKLFGMLYPDERYEIILDPLPGKSWLAMAADVAMTGFLRRTFDNVSIHHRLTPPAMYLGHRTRFGNTARLHVHLRPGTVDIMAFDSGSTLLVNTFAVTGAPDAIYYTLAVANTLGFDPEANRLYLSGTADWKPEFTTSLGEHLTHPMPMIYPSEMIRAGGECFNAPIELITLPLCEL